MKSVPRNSMRGKYAATSTRGTLVLTLGIVLGFPLWPTLGVVDSASAASVLHVPRDFSTIQAAVNGASPGDIIQVRRGTYAENVLVTTPEINLHALGATLDGIGLGGNGIHVVNTDGVVIMGFVVENYENGIVLQNTNDSVVHLNELRNNVSPPMGLLTRNGILLNNAHDNLITNNSIHDNGHNGITLLGESSSNTFRANSVVNNGTQVVGGFFGCGIQTGGPNNDNNVIVANRFLGDATGGQGWGIQIGSGGESSGNVIRQNRVRGNRRAGIALFLLASGNVVQQNNAKGNGVGNLGPSGTFDLWDEDGAVNDNTWERNQGTSNF